MRMCVHQQHQPLTAVVPKSELSVTFHAGLEETLEYQLKMLTLKVKSSVMEVGRNETEHTC